MASNIAEGKSGGDMEGYRDYRGVQVVGAYRWLPTRADFISATFVTHSATFSVYNSTDVPNVANSSIDSP